MIEIIDFFYRKKREEYEKRLEEIKNPYIVWVTELVGCPLKHHYRVRYPELSFTFSQKMVIGDIIHKGLQEFLVEFVKDKGFVPKCKDINIEHDIEVKIGDVFPDIESEDIRNTIVRGRIDALLEVEGSLSNSVVPIEIKFTSNDTHIPYKHHVEQLAIYMYLLQLKGYCCGEGYLIYITPNTIKQFIVYHSKEDIFECRDISVEVDLIGRLEDIFMWDEDIILKRREDWECNYCPYREVCKYRK